MTKSTQSSVAAMDKAELKSFTAPYEVREFPKGRLELVKVGGAIIGRAVFEPGWRWATSVQPLAKTRSCEAPHFHKKATGRLLDGRTWNEWPTKRTHGAGARQAEVRASA